MGEVEEQDIQAMKALGEALAERAKKKGATTAEVLLCRARELSTKVRMGEPELVQEAATYGVGLRVFREGKSAQTHTSDTSSAGQEALLSDAMELLDFSERDPELAPADPALFARSVPELGLFDSESRNIDAQGAKDRALEAETAAFETDARVKNSEGARFFRTLTSRVLVSSSGFSEGYCGSYQRISVEPVVDDEGKKKRSEGYWDGRRTVADLASPRSVGKEAALRTLARLGSRKVPSCEVPVVFDPDAARALLSLFFSTVSGHAIYRRGSYLCDQEGSQVASEKVTIVDDPLLEGLPGSRPFDGEGLAARTNVVVESGVLKNYLLDTYSAQKLGKKSNGCASRGLGGRPTVGASNFHLLPGNQSPEEIIAGVDRGLYVTGTMGFGFNAVTGDFSRGAEGFWIENGRRTYPVGEITIALNFKDLWPRVDAVGNDLDPKTGMCAPTFRVRAMTLAGT